MTLPITRRALLERALTLSSAAVLLGYGSAAAQQQQQSPPSGDPKSGGTLRIGKTEDLLLAGAPYVAVPGNIILYNLVYDTLLGFDQQFNIRPRLASSWAWSSDFRELTLQLRSDVMFHTGRPFTSDDARFNLERLRDPAVGSQWQNYARLMQVSAPAPDVLVIRYDAPVRSSVDTLALTSMADPQTVDQIASGGPFIGTGAFRFQEWVPGDHISVQANANYWQPGRPYLDGVELRVLPDPQSAVVALEAGSVDWLTGVPGVDARRLQADPAYQVFLSGSGGTFYYMGLDVAVPALADKRVRQALAYVVNRQRLVDTALFGFGRPSSIPWPQESPAYDATLDQTYPYDPARARRLLDDAGWDPNTVLPLSVPNGLAVATAMAQIIQADLAAIGVQVQVQSLNQADFLARLQKAQFGGAWIVSMGFMNFSPATFFQSALPVRVPNASNFSSQRYQDLVKQAFGATDDQQLQQSITELTRILLDEAFVITIAEGAGQQAGPVVANANARNVSWDRAGNFGYQDVWLAQVS